MSTALATVTGEPVDPPAGVEYQRVFTGPGQSLLRSAVGILFGFSLYVLLASLVSQLVVTLGWLGAGRPGSYRLYLDESLHFLHPIGLLGTNLGLASLVGISLAMARALNLRRPRWMASVQPGMRWRYLALCFVLASVVLNAVLLLGRGSWHADPQQHLWLWLAIVLLTSPLQAAGEEYLFRGYLLQAFGGMPRDGSAGWGRWFGVVASAAVFAFSHGVQNLPLFLDRFGFGLLAGTLVVLTGGLEAGIACHIANNIFAFTWAALSGGIAQARALQAITWASAASDLAGFALFGAVAWWLSRRMNLATRTAASVDLAHAGAIR